MQVQLGEPVRIAMNGEQVWICVAKIRAPLKRLPWLGSDSRRPPPVEEVSETLFVTSGTGFNPEQAMRNAKERLLQYAGAKLRNASK